MQLLHRKSNLLNLLHDCLMNFALNWFKSQSKFISLHDFDIVFTKTFSSNESATNSTTSRKQLKFENSISNRCQWCHLIYEIWNSHRLQYSSCDVQNQQTYEFVLQFLEEYTNEIVEQQKTNALKIAKKIKINAVKNAKRVKSKAIKVEKVAKSTSTIQNIDIFDSIFIYENRRFSEFARFLQHFQQCQHLYRESDLLMLLLICFWNSVFDIWFDRQTIMKSTSLNEWIDILRVDFANASFTKIKIANIICMRCDSNFNFKKKFREHVREQHAKKSVNSSSFSFNTVKSICEVKENSIVTCSSDSSISQKSEISIATSKQIFHSRIFETVISSKYSHFTSSASEIVFELIKNTSIQCSFISSKSSSFQTFESKHHELAIQKSEEKSSLLTISSDKLVCEMMKKSTIIDSSVSQKFDISIATSKQKFESDIIFETIISSENSHFSFNASEIVSKSIKNMSTQCSTISKKSFILFSTFKKSCFICRINVSSIQKHYFEFSSCHETLRYRLEQQFARRAHQREQKTQKQVELIEQKSRKQNSHLSINAINLVCEIEKKSYITHVESLIFATSKNLTSNTETFLQSVSSKCSSFQLRALNSASKLMKNVSIQRIVCDRTTCRRCNQIFDFNNKFHEHIREHHARKFVKSLNFRARTSKFTYKIIEKSTDIRSFTSFILQKSFISFSTSRNQIFTTKIVSRSVSSNDSNLSIATHKITSKFVKTASINDLFISFATFSSMFRKSISKSHFTIDDLFRMFRENSRSFDLRQHHNQRFFSQNFDFRQLDRSCSTFSKSHLIIENLFEMFDERFRRKSSFQNQKHVSFREFSSNQSRITIYFKSEFNQKSSVSQDSKNSKSKSLNQHMFAKSTRTVFSKNLFEKLIDLSYKLSDVFCHLKFSNSNKIAKVVFFIFIFFLFFSTFLFAFAFVSTISAAKMNCISVYQQIISIIDRVDIEFVASKRNWEETRNKLFEYSITKHFQKDLLHLLNESYTSIIACVQISMR